MATVKRSNTLGLPFFICPVNVLCMISISLTKKWQLKTVRILELD